jgi:predicted TIM-barrel fold metal-dependent hydrolase
MDLDRGANPAAHAIPWPQDRSIPTPSWRPPADHIVVSADDHVMEPPNLWVERMPASLRDAAPRLWKDVHGYHLEIEGRSFDKPGFNSQLIEGRLGIEDQAARLADMDQGGIDISIIFPQRAMGLFIIQDQRKLTAAADAYNEWLGEWSAAAPDRLIGVPLLPCIHEPREATAYVAKLKAMGFKAVMLPSYPRDVRYNSSAMEPIWDAVEANDMALCFHIGEFGFSTGKGALLTYITKQLQSFRELWALLTYSGVFQRHERLRVVFTEGGAGWASSAIYEADRVYRQYLTEANPKLDHLPSYYWRQNCSATIMDDPLALREAAQIGVQNILWSTDYPHPEGILGEEMSVLKTVYDTLGTEQARLVAGGNAVRIFGLRDEAERRLATRLSGAGS